MRSEAIVTGHHGETPQSEVRSCRPSLAAAHLGETEDGGLGGLVAEHRELARAFAELTSSSDDSWTKKKQIIHLRQMICAHEDVEASMLAPLIRSRIPDGRDLWRSSLRCYRTIEKLLVLVDRRSISSPDLPELLEGVESSISDLVVHQETSTFPQLRSALSQEELKYLGDRLVLAHEHATSRPHPFLPHRGRFAHRTRATMAYLDKRRDQMTPRL